MKHLHLSTYSGQSFMNFKNYITCIFLVVSINFCFGQNFSLHGTITHYNNQAVALFQCYGDTLLFVDSTHTNKNGEFVFSDKTFSNSDFQGFKNLESLLKVVLQNNQWFYVLCDGKPIEIKTLFQPNAFYNIATDSLVVIKSENNKQLYEFQYLQTQLNVTNSWLLQMMRLYPLEDPFHQQIEDEYFKRYAAMEGFLATVFAEDSMRGSSSPLGRLGGAYFPFNPDWKQPDQWRDSIIAAHYFDYFNPADTFYLHTNILPEKMEVYLQLKTNKTDDYGQPVRNEAFLSNAAHEFLEQTKSNTLNFEFCLNYLLKKFDKEHLDNAFLYLYDSYAKPQTGDCESTIAILENLKEKANKLRNVAIGSNAPNFNISDKLQLNDIQSDYTLLLFWATWCPHCTQVVPQLKKVVDDFNQKTTNKLLTIAVSLDTDEGQWQKFVTENNLLSFLNFSEFKGWQSEVVKRYNVYATPTMFLLDKDKKIIAKPITEQELSTILLQTKKNL